MSMSSIELPKTINSLGNRAFSSCTSLHKVNIPKALEFAGANAYNGAFYGCSGLKTVEFEDGITSIIDSLFGYSGLETITIPDTVTSIGYQTFGNCTSLKNVELSNSTTEIGDCAFENCKSLIGIALPNTITEIEGYAFYNCSSLKSIEVPDSVTSMGDSVFDGCSSLESAKLPKDITSIPSSTFGECTSLKTISIPSKVKTIGGSAFSGCTTLESFSFPEGSSLKEINSSAFYGCTALKEADVPFGTTSIGDYAFKNCTALEKVTIPRTVKNIYNQAFMGCETLKEVNIADYSITEIANDTFKDCPSIEKIVLPKGLTKIGSQAFMNCTSLVEVTIPESVTSIETNALSYPDKTTIRGRKGSFAETFANENGFKFVDYSIPVEGIILKGDDDDHIDIELGETFYAEFEFYPEDANDVVTLKADNSNVTIKGHDIVGNYYGDTTITATTTSGMEYEFTVHTRRVSEIRIIANPTKTTYLMGESFDPTGMEVQAVYDDGFSRVVDGWTVTGFDSSKEGKNTITVNWTAPSGSTYEKTLELTIVDPTPKLTGIFIETEPTKTAYELREKLDLTGMVVKGIYTDGSKKEITDYTTSGYNALKKGTHTITVTYEGFTDTFTVTVGETPTEPETEPTEPETKPTEPETEPTEPETKPTEPETEPTEPETKPTEPETEPTEPETKPTEPETKPTEPVTETLTDNKTNISVTVEGEDTKATLKVDVIEGKDVDTSSVGNFVAAYNITLLMNDVEVQPDNAVTIEVPCINQNAKVYRVETGGGLTDMNAVYQDGYLVFTTDCFSTYIVAEEKKQIPGDVDGDGKVSVVDATLVQRHVAKLTTLDATQLLAADTYKDGEITVVDATTIQRFVAKLITEL